MRISGTSLTVLAVLAAAAGPANAAYDPVVRLDVPVAGGPGAPAAITTTFTQAQGEEATSLVEAVIPGTFGFNPSFAVAGCGPADEQAGTCPAASRIGTIAADSPFGQASGDLFLTEDFRLRGIVTAYGGLIRFEVTGVLRVMAGQEVAVRFAGLPNLATTRMSLALDGGDRTPLALPRQCGTSEIAVLLRSHAGTERRSRFPVVITGCRVRPDAPVLRVARSGGAFVAHWRLRSGMARTEVSLRRLRGGMWHELGKVSHPARNGANSIRIGPRWRGRRLTGARYRVRVVAVSRSGARSPASWADFRLR